MAVIGSDSFTGTTGAVWASPWTTGTTPTGGSATIQSNVGRMVVGSSTTAYDFAARVSRRYGTTSRTDVVISGKFRYTGNQVYPQVFLRADTNLQGGTGYQLFIDAQSGNWSVQGNNSFSSLFQGPSVNLTFSANTWYAFRFGVVGTSIKARVWLDGTTEPSTWGYETTNSTLTTGQCGLATFPGNVPSAYVEYDDFVLEDSFPATTIPGDVTGTATAGASVAGTVARAGSVTGTATAGASVAGTVARADSVTGTATAGASVAGTVGATGVTGAVSGMVVAGASAAGAVSASGSTTAFTQANGGVAGTTGKTAGLNVSASATGGIIGVVSTPAGVTSATSVGAAVSAVSGRTATPVGVVTSAGVLSAYVVTGPTGAVSGSAGPATAVTATVGVTGTPAGAVAATGTVIPVFGLTPAVATAYISATNVLSPSLGEKAELLSAVSILASVSGIVLTGNEATEGYAYEGIQDYAFVADGHSEIS